MTVKEYNRDFLPRIQRAREFVSLFESAINHMDDARVDKEEVLAKLQSQGYFVQMPPQDVMRRQAELRAREAQDNIYD